MPYRKRIVLPAPEPGFRWPSLGSAWWSSLRPSHPERPTKWHGIAFLFVTCLAALAVEHGLFPALGMLALLLVTVSTLALVFSVILGLFGAIERWRAARRRPDGSEYLARTVD
jgi:hypothetical protein